MHRAAAAHGGGQGKGPAQVEAGGRRRKHPGRRGPQGCGHGRAGVRRPREKSRGRRRRCCNYRCRRWCSSHGRCGSGCSLGVVRRCQQAQNPPTLLTGHASTPPPPSNAPLHPMPRTRVVPRRAVSSAELHLDLWMCAVALPTRKRSNRTPNAAPWPRWLVAIRN